MSNVSSPGASKSKSTASTLRPLCASSTAAFTRAIVRPTPPLKEWKEMYTARLPAGAAFLAG